MSNASKILLLLPKSITYKKIVQEALESINLDKSIEVETREVSVSDMTANIDEDAIDVVIVRSIGARIFDREIPQIPVVTVDIRDMELVEAVYRAKIAGTSKIAVVDYYYNKNYFDMEFIEKLLGIKIECIFLRKFNDQEEIHGKFVEAVKAGIESIVSQWVFITNEAIKYGFSTEVAYCSKENVAKSIDQACKISLSKAYEKNQKVKFAAVVDGVSDSIIVIDERGMVNHLNPSARKIVDDWLVGKSIQAYSPEHILRALYGNGRECDYEYVTAKNEMYIVSRKRIRSGKGEEEEIVIFFQPAKNIVRAEKSIRKKFSAHQGFHAKYLLQNIIGNSDSIRQTLKEAARFARSDATVLIFGESGTGKELLAHGIHMESNRSSGPFVPVNCASIPKTLVESELFGYEEGAFTGAQKGGKPGLFELADNGTIFIDEIGDLDLSSQARLLRVLQEMEVIRLGGTQIIPINARIIAATNKDLREEIIAGNFRQDLFYRLNVLTLQVAPLRERREDIPLLFKHFVSAVSKRIKVEPIAFLTEEVEKLKEYSWPGNVRELENFVERSLALGADIPFGELANSLTDCRESPLKNPGEISVRLDTLKNMELQLIQKTQEALAGSQTELAKILGVSRQTLWNKFKEIESDSIT